MILLLACVTTSTTPPTAPVEAPATEAAPEAVAPVETAPTGTVDGEAVESAVPAPLLTRAATSSTTTGPCACATNGDIDKFCPGVLASQGKTAQVRCLNAEETDGDADHLSAGCLDSLAYAAGLNASVLAACASEKKLWCASAGPKLGEEVCFDLLRQHAATNSAGCATALAEHQANQDAVKACTGR